MKRNAAWILIAGAALAAAQPAGAERPTRTEGSPLVAPGSVRVGVGWEAADVTAELDATAEVMAVTAGLAPCADLTLSGSYLHLDSGSEDANGVGDPLAIVRVRVAEERGRRPSIDFSLGVKFPSGDHLKGLGTEETDFLTTIGLGRNYGRTRAHLDAGMTIVGLVHRPHEQDDSFLFGLTLEREVAGGTRLVLDWFGESKTNIRRNPFPYHVRHDQALLLGVRIDAVSLTWDAAFMKPVAGDTHGWGFTIGASRTIRFLR